MATSSTEDGGFEIFSRMGDYIRGYDAFGVAIQLNYKGSDTYQSIPGGMITIVSYCVLFLYALLMFKLMHFK